MESTTPLIASLVVSFLAALSHILSAALQSWLTASLDVELKTVGLHYHCDEAWGLFHAEIVTGTSSATCPTETSGYASTKLLCGKDANPPNAEDCDTLRAGQAMVVLSSMFSIITFLLVIYQYVRSKKDLTFSKLKTVITSLTIFAGMFSLASIIIFEVRSHDEDTGWSDGYGCEYGAINVLFNSEGTTCFQRGPAYIFCCLGLSFSLLLGLVNCLVGREFFNKEKERFGSFYTNLENTV